MSCKGSQSRTLDSHSHIITPKGGLFPEDWTIFQAQKKLKQTNILSRSSRLSSDSNTTPTLEGQSKVKRKGVNNIKGDFKKIETVSDYSRMGLKAKGRDFKK